MCSPPSRAELHALQNGFPLACLNHFGHPQLVLATADADCHAQTQLVVASKSIRSKAAIHKRPKPAFPHIHPSDMINVILLH